MKYCAACGKVLVQGDIGVWVHGKWFCSEPCVAVFESRDVELVIEANLDNDGEGDSHAIRD
jgi:hypothetical protein